MSRLKQIGKQWAKAYENLLNLAKSPWATKTLFSIAFFESIIFPFPTDLWLIPTCIARPKKAISLSLMTTFFSVLGALVAYAIGYYFGDDLVLWLQSQASEESGLGRFLLEAHKHTFKWILLAAFTFLPFKVFTLAAGVLQAPLLPFLMGSLVGRTFRFLTQGVLIYFLGDRANVLIKKYFMWLSLALALLCVGYWLWRGH